MAAPHLERQLGLGACISIVVGAIIGSGIFMKPAVMAGQVGSPFILLLVWVVAGIVSLFGGMINAEVGTVLPKTGGQYIYFQHMYGNFFAFLYGWAAFVVINTAAIAAIAFVFAQYTQYFVQLPRFSAETEQLIRLTIPGIGHLYPLENFGVKVVAIIVIVLLSTINYVSLKAGSTVQVFFTVIKIGSLLLLAGIIFFSGNGSTENFFHTDPSVKKTGWEMVLGFIAATSGALAAYDGWNNLGFVAGEIKNPRQNIPRGLVIGLLICITMYVLTNQAYLYMLPVQEMKDAGLVASDALNKVMAVTGGGLIAAMVIISTFGAVNGSVLPCARIQFAMGREGYFFKAIGKVHPKYHTPGNALLLQMIWACLFVLTGSFDMLTDVFVFVTWLFYGFAAYGLFILRKKMPDAQRAYKVWGYPFVPVIFILFATFYFFLTLYNDISSYLNREKEFINSAYGLILTILGIPLYWYFKKRKKIQLHDTVPVE